MFPVLGTALVSPVLDSLIEPFGTTSANIGMMMSIFTAPAIVMIPITGLLADRYGRKLVLSVSVALFGVAGSAIALTTDYRLILGLRLLQGVGFAGTNPVIITSIADLYAGEREATGQGLRFMVSGLSGSVFPLFAGALVVLAWRFPFFLYALAVPVALAVYLWFDGQSSDSSNREHGTTDLRSYVRSLLELVRMRRVLAMVVARSLMATIFIGFLTYNSLIVVRLLGGTPVQAGFLAALGYFTFAMAASQAGRITAVFESRLYPLLGANVSLSTGFVTVLFAPGLDVALIGITAFGIGFGILGSLYRSIIAGFAPANLRAGLVSVSEASGRVSSTLTPLYMGGAIAFLSPMIGFTMALQLAGLGVAVGGGIGGSTCVLLARRSQLTPVEKRAQADT